MFRLSLKPSILLIVLLLVISVGYAKTSMLDELVVFDTYTSLMFPALTEGTGRTLMFGEESDFSYKIWVDKVSGEINLIFDMQAYSIESVFTPDIKLKFCEAIVKPAGAKIKNIAKFDKYTAIRDDSDNTLLFSIYNNGKLKKKRKVAVDGNTIDADNMFIYIQAALLSGVKKEFICEMIDPLSMKKYKMKLKSYGKKASELKALTPKFKFPTEMDEIFNSSKEYYVYEMKLKGVVGWMMNLKYFFAFDETAPYNAVVYWGGTGPMTMYSYMKTE